MESSLKEIPRMQSSRIGFQAKLLIVFTVLLFVVTALLVFIHYRSEKVLLDRSVANLRNMVNIVHYSTQSFSTEKPIRPKELDRLLHEVIGKKGAFEASVIDFENQIIASTNGKKIGSLSPLPPDSIGVWALLDESESLSDKVRYEVRIPLVKHKQVEGIVEISVLQDDLRSQLWKFSRDQILVLTAALILAFALFLFFLRRLHRPFMRMAAAAKKIANGDFNVHLDDMEKGEEGEMAAAFNYMTLKLLEQRMTEERLFAMERRAILSELSASLAHEIRNPLNLMNLTLHHLGKTYAPPEENRESFNKLVGSLKDEIQHLNQIVTDFLTLGKPNRPAKKPFNLGELVSDIAVRLNQQMGIKGLHLEIRCPKNLELNADEEQIRLVILNLFLNCMDLVPLGSEIMFLAEKTPEGIECTITDEGPGIVPDDLERIFEPYFTRRAWGMGLGLTLVRRIIEDHGGEIHAANRSGGGAEFHFTFPSS